MNDRETLMDLLGYCSTIEGYGEDLRKDKADYLIANGVMIKKYGRWIDEVELRPELYGWVPLNSVVCSLCNKSNGRETLFCPNCGAKMDLEERKC